MKRMLLLLIMTAFLLMGCTVSSAAKEPTPSGAVSAGNSSQDSSSQGDSPRGSSSGNGGEQPAGESPLPKALLESYYLSPEEPVHAYLQNKSIQRFCTMWAVEKLGEGTVVNWAYDTLAPVLLLDENFNRIDRPEKRLYNCNFTTEDGRNGYMILSYEAEGPSITRWGAMETTPYLYDLRANEAEIAAALEKTDIDLATATAQRVEWTDTKNNRGDRIILFTDGKGERYICYLGTETLTVEKR